MRRVLRLLSATLVMSAVGSTTAWAQEDVASASAGGGRFEITITNLTRDQTFTPVLVASHRQGVRLFELGEPASTQLAILAEEGDVAPLTTLLQANPGVLDVTFTGPPPGGFIGPGQTRTIAVRTRGNFDRVSVAAMLIPTNDGFFALNGVEGLRNGQARSFFSPAYDAAVSAMTSCARRSRAPISRSAAVLAAVASPRVMKKATSTSMRASTGLATSRRVGATGAIRSLALSFAESADASHASDARTQEEERTYAQDIRGIRNRRGHLVRGRPVGRRHLDGKD